MIEEVCAVRSAGSFIPPQIIAELGSLIGSWEPELVDLLKYLPIHITRNNVIM